MSLINNWWPELIVLITAASPISELRGAIPLAFGVYQMGILKSFFLSVIGNTIPPIILLWLLGPISGFLITRSVLAERFFNWLFTRTRHKFSGQYEIWGEIALMIFVAIPFPLTGAWTGSIAAFLFGIPKKQSLVFILGGIMIAGVIVTLMTLGVFSLL
jgi:uncharacterized membrane protein